MHRFLNAALLSVALIVPLAMAPSALRADDDRHDDHDRVYHDRDHDDDHHWDNREDRAYRIWVRENHRRYETFERLREEDRRAYWGWRHEHPDAVLHIDIH
jgi:hypothetical protein